MLGITDLKMGTKITYESDPYIVVNYSHSKMGRGGAVVKTKLKNLRTGGTIDKTFQGADKVDEADLSKKTAMFLYCDEVEAFFMDNDSFEQFTLPLEKIGKQKDFLIENSNVDILYFGDEPLSIELPIKMTFEVVYAPPAVRGNTASAITKKVTLSGGIIVDAPIFIKEGDKVIVNTVDASYVERA
jgi:elongation factor P